MRLVNGALPIGWDVYTGLEEDLIFAEKVESAWRAHDKGTFKKKSQQDFLKELRVC